MAINSLFIFGWIYCKEVCFGQLYFSLSESNLLYFIFSDSVFCFTFFFACFVSSAVFWNLHRLLSFAFFYPTFLSLSSISWSSLSLLSLLLLSLDFSFCFVFFFFFFNQIISHLRRFFLRFVSFVWIFNNFFGGSFFFFVSIFSRFIFYLLWISLYLFSYCFLFFLFFIFIRFAFFCVL